MLGTWYAFNSRIVLTPSGPHSAVSFNYVAPGQEQAVDPEHLLVLRAAFCLWIMSEHGWAPAVSALDIRVRAQTAARTDGVDRTGKRIYRIRRLCL